jgi:hypothetical protein
MGIRISVDGVQQLGTGVWRANIGPAEVRLLGSPATTLGGVTVILIDVATHSEQAGRLEFDAIAARPLNMGTTLDTIIICGAYDEEERRLEPRTPDNQPSLPHGDQKRTDLLWTGDEKLLAHLPESLKSLGNNRLSAIRKEFPGQLRYYPPPTERFVESNGNWWAVKIQPRSGDLAVIFRGALDEIYVPSSIELKPDRHGYLRFKIAREEQIPEALTVLKQARRR